jgi:hypothetical protein
MAEKERRKRKEEGKLKLAGPLRKEAKNYKKKYCSKFNA